MTGDNRTFEPDPDKAARLARFMAATLPDSGPAVRSKTCLYTLTPDRDFLLGPVPGHAAVQVALGAGHGFKFAPTFGRVLGELAIDDKTETDVTTYRLDRPVLLEDEPALSWRI